MNRDDLRCFLALRREDTDKLTDSASGTWECHASFDRNSRSEWALASIYRALQSPSRSASPRLRVNLSVPETPLAKVFPSLAVIR